MTARSTSTRRALAVAAVAVASALYLAAVQPAAAHPAEDATLLAWLLALA